MHATLPDASLDTNCGQQAVLRLASYSEARQIWQDIPGSACKMEWLAKPGKVPWYGASHGP